jgi:hypothetical protein
VDEEFYLFIASSEPESATSQLKTSGVHYRRKRLDSSPENWQSICDILLSPNLIGVVAKLTGHTCSLLLSDKYAHVSSRFVELLSATRHIVFIHETLLFGEEGAEPQEDEPSLNPDDEWSFLHSWPFWEELKSEERREFVEMINKYHLNLAPYKRNAELSVLASKFVQEHDKRLLFRVYIPSGRMWAAEADRLLSLFRDWITKFKSQRVRQDGYSTRQGKVYEFYSDGGTGESNLGEELQQFSDFLELCITQPESAQDLLKNERISGSRLGQSSR